MGSLRKRVKKKKPPRPRPDEGSNNSTPYLAPEASSSSSSGLSGLEASLTEGAREARRVVTEKLRKLGFDIPDVTLPDGSVAPDPQKVKIATKAVQADAGLPITGEPDDATHSALDDAVAPAGAKPLPQTQKELDAADAAAEKENRGVKTKKPLDLSLGDHPNVPTPAAKDVEKVVRSFGDPGVEPSTRKIPTQGDFDAAKKKLSLGARSVPTSDVGADGNPTPKSIGHSLAEIDDGAAPASAPMPPAPGGVTSVEEGPASPDSALGLAPAWYGALTRFASGELDPLKPGSNDVHSQAITAGIHALKSGDPWARRALDAGILPQGPWSAGQSRSVVLSPEKVDTIPEITVDSNPEPAAPDLSSAGVKEKEEARPQITNIGQLLAGIGAGAGAFPSELGGVEAAAQGIGRMDSSSPAAALSPSVGAAPGDSPPLSSSGSSNPAMGMPPTGTGLGSGSGISQSDIGAALAGFAPTQTQTPVEKTGISAGDQVRQSLIAQALGF